MPQPTPGRRSSSRPRTWIFSNTGHLRVTFIVMCLDCQTAPLKWLIGCSHCIHLHIYTTKVLHPRPDTIILSLTLWFWPQFPFLETVVQNILKDKVHHTLKKKQVILYHEYISSLRIHQKHPYHSQCRLHQAPDPSSRQFTPISPKSVLLLLCYIKVCSTVSLVTELITSKKTSTKYPCNVYKTSTAQRCDTDFPK